MTIGTITVKRNEISIRCTNWTPVHGPDNPSNEYEASRGI
jgi:hypothetical protein